MELAVRRILHEIEKIRIIDPHSHIEPSSPCARSLNDLLGYHYFTELAHACGMEKSDLEADGKDLARRIAGWLPGLANTVQYSWLIKLSKHFFGLKQLHVDSHNIDELFEQVAITTAQADWTDRVFSATNLEAIFLTNNFDDPLEGFDVKRFVPCLRTDELTFKLDQATVRSRFEKVTGIEPQSFAALRQGLSSIFDHFRQHGVRACAISLPPDFEPARPGERETEEAYARLIAGDASADDRIAVSYATFFAIADACEDFNLPFDLMIGVRRDVYAEGVFQGTDLFDQRTSLYQYRKLFNEKGTVVFPVSVLTHMQNQELVAYSWIFPNVVASGHWWYSNIPGLIEADVRSRLEAIPANKIIGYYSDAYKLEFVFPKYSMYRECLARVLFDHFVVSRGWTEERAVALAQKVLRDNVVDLFYGGKLE